MSTLKQWMAENGVGDDEVAEKIGVSRVSVLRYRLGQTRPRDPKTVEKLAALTGIPEWDLIKPSAA